LCCHFTRNCAYYKASYENGSSKATNEFEVTIQGNFIDISILEWLKLFGDHNDKHHWKKVVENPDDFKSGMFESCSITEDDLVECRESFKTYRDKFVAHLDSEETMQIPVIDLALKVVKYYYECVSNELGISNLGRLPKSIESYYQDCFCNAGEYFEK